MSSLSSLLLWWDLADVGFLILKLGLAALTSLSSYGLDISMTFLPSESLWISSWSRALGSPFCSSVSTKELPEGLIELLLSLSLADLLSSLWLFFDFFYLLLLRFEEDLDRWDSFFGGSSKSCLRLMAGVTVRSLCCSNLVFLACPSVLILIFRSTS